MIKIVDLDAQIIYLHSLAFIVDNFVRSSFVTLSILAKAAWLKTLVELLLRFLFLVDDYRRDHAVISHDGWTLGVAFARSQH